MGKIIRREMPRAHKSVTLTLTSHRTACVTHQFIVMPWTVGPTITQLVTVYARRGIPAPEESWTRQLFTTIFVHVVQTVIHSIAACVDRQAVVVVTGTAVMAVRTGLVHRHRG